MSSGGAMDREERPAPLLPCPFCASVVRRASVSARLQCLGCGWEFVPPGTGGWTPERVEGAWRIARGAKA